jgi:hypothetical protein
MCIYLFLLIYSIAEILQKFSSDFVLYRYCTRLTVGNYCSNTGNGNGMGKKINLNSNLHKEKTIFLQ